MQNLFTERNFLAQIKAIDLKHSQELLDKNMTINETHEDKTLINKKKILQ